MVLIIIKPNFFKILLLSLIYSLLTARVNAVEWIINPFIEVKSDFSDNILQSENSKEFSFVGQINPGLALTGLGARSQYTLDYRLQTLNYSSGTLTDTYYQQAKGSFAYELVRSTLLFYADASMGQANKDIYKESLDDNLTDPENITDVYRLKSGLLWDQRIKNKAQIYLDANTNYLHERENLPNVKGWDIQFRTNSTYQISAGFWDISYLGSERKPEQDEHTLLQQGQVQLGVQAWRHLALFGVANRERNEVPDSVVTADLNSGSMGAGLRWRPNQRTMFSVAYNFGVYKDTPDFWSLNFALTPNPRVKIQGGYGQRFYGDAYNFELSYQGKHIQTLLSYKEELSSYSRSNGSDSQTDSLESNTNSSDGSSINEEDKDPTADDVEEEPVYTSVNSSVYLDRVALWSTKRMTGRHAFILDLSYSERDYVTQAEEQRDLAGKFNWHIYLGERSTVKLNTLYRKLRRSERTSDYQTGETLQYGDEWLSGVAFNRRLSRRSDIELRLQHKDKEGVTNVGSYTENRLGLYYTLRAQQ